MKSFFRRIATMFFGAAALGLPLSAVLLVLGGPDRCCPAHTPRTAPVAATASPQPMLVLLEDPWTGQAEPAGMVGTLAERDAFMGDLIARATVSQRDFLERVSPAGIRGVEGLSASRFHWIVNALEIELTPAEADQIRGMEGVRDVIPDEEVSLIAPLFRPEPGPSTDRILEDDDDSFTYGLKLMRLPEFRQAHPGIDGRGVTIGQIDTGIHGTHEQFAGKQIIFQSFVDDTTEANDDNGHGTHISGTIFGNNVSSPAVGVAPGVTKVYVGKVFSSRGGATVGTLLDAMEWMADPDGDGSTADAPRLVSNSWGGPGGRETFREAVRRWVALGIFPVFAAGNSGPRPRSVGVPGGYPEALAVGAVDSKRKVARFSSRGPARYDGKEYVKPDVSAPGVAVFSAWVPKPGSDRSDPEYDRNYRSISGTSMATPHVAGALTLLYQAKPDLTIDQARQLLESSTRPVEGATGKNNDSGTGLLDVVLLFENLKAMTPAVH